MSAWEVPRAERVAYKTCKRALSSVVRLPLWETRVMELKARWGSQERG